MFPSVSLRIDNIYEGTKPACRDVILINHLNVRLAMTREVCECVNVWRVYVGGQRFGDDFVFYLLHSSELIIRRRESS